MDFSTWRPILQEEYKWLMASYPLQISVQPPLILLADLWVTNNQNEVVRSEGEVLELSSGGYMIGLSIQETPVWDEQQINWATMYKIPLWHLYAFMLYHEYGHLWEMNQVYMSHGEQAMKNMLEVHDELVMELRHQELLRSKEEISTLYRLLPMEEYADRFAKRVYEQRKMNLWLPE